MKRKRLLVKPHKNTTGNYVRSEYAGGNTYSKAQTQWRGRFLGIDTYRGIDIMRYLHTAHRWASRLLVHPLFLLLIFTISLFLFLQVSDVEGTYDSKILLFIGAVYLISSIFMVIQTRWDRWTVLSAGMFATFLGNALLYLATAVASLGHERWFMSGLLIAIRSLFVVGGVWVLSGIAQEWWIAGGFCKEVVLEFLKNPKKVISSRQQLKQKCEDNDEATEGVKKWP